MILVCTVVAEVLPNSRAADLAALKLPVDITPLPCQNLSIFIVSGIQHVNIVAGHCSVYHRHHKVFVRNKKKNQYNMKSTY